MKYDVRVRPFGELVENHDSKRIPVKESDRRPGPYPYYGASGIVDHIDSFIFDGEYLLVAEDGENLRTRKTPVAFLANGKFWVNNHAHIVRANNESNTRFLMYSLEAADVRGYLTGSAMPKLTQGNLNRIPVVAPPLPEQQTIADILGTLDDKIELNRRMNKTLEEMAAAIFSSWMADNRGESISGKVSDLIEQRLLSVGDGYRAKRAELAADGLPFARAGNVDGGFHFDGCEYLGKPGVEAAREKVSQVWDSVFTSKGTVGRTALVFPGTQSFVYAPQLCYWRSLNASQLHPIVIHQWMRSSEFQRQMHMTKGQTDMADYVSLTDQRAMTITLPPASAQADVGEKLTSIYLSLDTNTKESRTLAELRDALLPKLLSGELSIGRASVVKGEAH